LGCFSLFASHFSPVIPTKPAAAGERTACMSEIEGDLPLLATGYRRLFFKERF
jgi:hypothetical protein